MSDKEMKFTYLFGAGASAEVIPVVKGLSNSFLSLLSFCRKELYGTIEDESYLIENKSEIKLYNDFISDIEILLGDLHKVASFDTLAKKHYLTSNVKHVNKMKCLLAIMFIHNYYIDKKRTDSRYELFIASLLEKEGNDISFPKNVNIVSWNYDFQFEMALSQFTDNRSIEEINRFINNFSTKEENQNLPYFIKLNGSSISFTDNRNKVFGRKLDKINELSKQEVEDENRIDFIKEFLKIYKRLSSEDENYNETISFTWEKDNQFILDVRNKALKISRHTNYLVVVGYSFPTFNRTLDHAFLSNLENINKIFIQTKEDFEDVKTRIIALCPKLQDKIVEIKSINEFYIPFEFNEIYSD